MRCTQCVHERVLTDVAVRRAGLIYCLSQSTSRFILLDGDMFISEPRVTILSVSMSMFHFSDSQPLEVISK